LAAALGLPVHGGQLAPTAKVGGGCIRFLVAPPGELRRMDGVQAASEVEGVKGVRLYRRRGHRFGPLLRGGDRAGAILAIGSSRDEALACADRAAKLIRFEVSSVKALAEV
jgi:hypothetical protein